MSYQVIPIGEVARLQSGYAFKSRDWSDSGIAVVRIKNVKEGNLDLSDCAYVSEDVANSAHKYRLHPGDILLSMTGYIGERAWVRSNDWIMLNQRVGRFVFDQARSPEVDRKYFFYAISFSPVLQELQNRAHGAAQPNISPKAVGEVSIPFPSLDCQRKISAILSAYDDLIENNTRRIEILEEMARRLYEEWFVHFRFPGHEGVSFKASELGEIPESWNIVKLESLCSKITDGAHKSPPSVEDGMPMASVKDMHNWGFYVPGCRKISKEDYNALVRGSCKPEMYDILIAKDGANLNKHTFLVVEEQDLVLLSSVAIIRPGDEVDPEFLASQLKSEEVSERIKLSKSGAAIPRIVLKDFKRLDILLPPQEIQAHWKQNAKPLADMCRLLTRKNETLRAQRDLLLPKLISGEIDVSDIPMPDDKEVEAA